MNEIAKSFAGLVASNNGFFKSEKQAKFLSSQCQDENVFITVGSLYRNSFTIEYHLDAKGVTKTVKSTRTKPMGEVTWLRRSDAEFNQVVELKAACDRAGARRAPGRGAVVRLSRQAPLRR